MSSITTKEETMKTIVFAIICALTFLGCVEPIEFHIDSECSSDERWAAMKTFEALNVVLGYEHAVITGSKSVDYETVSEIGGGHIVMCISDDDTASRFDYGDHIGWYHSGDIAVRSDLTTEEFGLEAFQRVMMHELIHLMGAGNDEHSDDVEDVFYSPLHFVIGLEDDISTEYTDADKEIIRKYSIL
jgi:hypothetical protein